METKNTVQKVMPPGTDIIESVLQLFSDISSMGFFVLNRMTAAHFNNRYLQKLLGVSQNRNILDALTEVMDLEDQPLFFTAWQTMLTTQTMMQCGFRLNFGKDAPRRFTLRIIPILNAEGQIHSTLGLMNDERWPNTTPPQSAHSTDETRSSLIHEIAQPLSIISAHTHHTQDYLAKQNIQDVELTQSLQKIAQQIKRCSQILDDARNPNLSSPTLRRHRHFDPLIQHVVAGLSPTLRQRIQFKYELQHPPQTISVADGQLEQVISNLIVNAAEAMTPNGTIVFHTDSDETNVYLVIHNSGVKIPEALQKKIFNAFLTTKKQGMGLGLTISRAICRRHGGDLSLVKSNEEGTTFQIALPRIKSD